MQPIMTYLLNKMVDESDFSELIILKEITSKMVGWN